jgi:hypothetical protein
MSSFGVSNTDQYQWRIQWCPGGTSQGCQLLTPHLRQDDAGRILTIQGTVDIWRAKVRDPLLSQNPPMPITHKEIFVIRKEMGRIENDLKRVDAYT